MKSGSPHLTLEWLRGEAGAGKLPGVPIDDLPLTTRAKSILGGMGVRTVADLLPLERSEYLRQHNCGSGTMRQIAAIQTVLRALVTE